LSYFNFDTIFVIYEIRNSKIKTFKIQKLKDNGTTMKTAMKTTIKTAMKTAIKTATLNQTIKI
jgi:hypothetical protein